MKKAFITLLAIISAVAFIAVLFGHTHQIAGVVISLLMILLLKKEKDTPFKRKGNVKNINF